MHQASPAAEHAWPGPATHQPAPAAGHPQGAAPFGAWHAAADHHQVPPAAGHPETTAAHAIRHAAAGAAYGPQPWQPVAAGAAAPYPQTPPADGGGHAATGPGPGPQPWQPAVHAQSVHAAGRAGQPYAPAATPAGAGYPGPDARAPRSATPPDGDGEAVRPGRGPQRTAPAGSPQGRRAARRAEEAAAGTRRAGDTGTGRPAAAARGGRGGRGGQGSGSPGDGRTGGAARPHGPWKRLVKAVALCAAAAATAMLVLRGNDALDRLAAPAPPDAKATAPAVRADAPDPGRVLQIVAHPDDDLYFMNPDLRYSIAAGHPVTSVYLTSGEADGINAAEGKQGSAKPDKPGYAEARQNGIRAAYAKMATGDRSSAWKRTVVPTRGGGQAEVDVLQAKPQVNLVWLQMREAGTVHDPAPDSLHGLWDGKATRLESVLASGTPVKQRFTYTKDQVVQTLVGVLEQYKPTTIRSQDPTPGRFPDTRRYTDHQDHLYGARFVQLATAAYAKDVKDRPHFAVQNYLGYVNGSLPSALDPDEAREKLDILGTYAWLDRQNHCGSNAGCGDLKVSGNPAGNRWTESINYARGAGTSWLTSDKEHGLWAFKVLDGQLAVWHRTGLIGRWSGPTLLPGTGMDQGMSTVTLTDGRIAVFGTRTSFGAKPADYKREVVYAVQQRPGAEEFGEWQSLGTPEAADENWTSDISAPAVSVDGTGRPAAYVRDGSDTLRGRVQQADGSWGPWEKYGGTDLHGTPATATDGAGRRMVFSSTSKTVVGWVQPRPGAPLGPATATGLPDTTLPLTAEGREGGVRLWFRKPGSGNVRTALVTGDGGLKVNHLTDLGGLQGFGAVTASGHVLAGRTAGGQLGSELGSGRPWERSPLMFVGAPSSTMTGKNMVGLAVLGLDARLYVTSSADAPDAYLAPWQPVGPRNTAP
ncbi:PIG-L family deacetylase [Streptomyces sp. NPDC088762]|uniref:PIG-L family deacetylase n=1 Tax=Streptomyces sp. NPDC088762 TaxID=3365891 RepID=UPI00380E9787